MGIIKCGRHKNGLPKMSTTESPSRTSLGKRNLADVITVRISRGGDGPGCSGRVQCQHRCPRRGERQAGPAHRRRCDADGHDDGLNDGGRDPKPRNAGGLRQLEMARRWIVPGRGATAQPSLDFCFEGN